MSVFSKIKTKTKSKTNKQKKKPRKNKLTEKKTPTTEKKPPHNHLAAGMDFCEIFLEISKRGSDALFFNFRQGHIKFLLSTPEKHFTRDLGRLNSL